MPIPTIPAPSHTFLFGTLLIALACTSWAQDSVPQGEAAVISDVSGSARIETRGKEKTVILYDSVMAGSNIWISTGSMLSLFLPDNSVVKYHGPVHVRFTATQEKKTVQSLSPIGEVVRGDPVNLPSLSDLVSTEKAGSVRLLKTRVAHNARFKALRMQRERVLLSPKGLVLSQTPTFRFLENEPEGLVITLSPSDGNEPGRLLSFPPERVFEFPNSSQPLERGCSYVVSEIGSASFTVISQEGATPLEASLGELKRTLPGSTGSLAQARTLLQMGLPCDALDRIDEIQAVVGVNDYLLSLREEAYRMLLSGSLVEYPKMDAVRKKMCVNTIAGNLLNQCAVSSSDGTFDFAVGLVSGVETLSVAPGAMVKSGSTLAFALRSRRDLAFDLYQVDSAGQMSHLWPGKDELRFLNSGEVLLGGGDSDWKLIEPKGVESFLMIGRTEGQSGELKMDEWEGDAIRATSQAIIESGSAGLREKWTGPLNDTSASGLNSSGLSWAIIRIRHGD